MAQIYQPDIESQINKATIRSMIRAALTSATIYS